MPTMSPVRNSIVAYIRNHGPSTPEVLIEYVAKQDSIRYTRDEMVKILTDLHRDGLVERHPKAKGRWVLKISVDAQKIREDARQFRKQIVNLLSHDYQTIDDLVHKTGGSVDRVSQVINDLQREHLIGETVVRGRRRYRMLTPGERQESMTTFPLPPQPRNRITNAAEAILSRHRHS